LGEFREIESLCTYCGVGCEIVAHVENGEIEKISTREEGRVSRGRLCIKGKYGYHFLSSPNRLRGALVRSSFVHQNPQLFRDIELKPAQGEFFSLSYGDGYRVVARKLSQIIGESGPQAVACIGGARTSCESSYLFQKFARQVIGTPHLDNCARICHSPSLKGLRTTIGEGAATNPFDDLYGSEHILVVGSNTTEAHPIVANRIMEAVGRGAKLTVIDIREIPLSKFASNQLTIPPETNLMVLNMVARTIVEKGWEKREFIEERCRGFEEYREALLADPLADRELFSHIRGYRELPEKIEILASDLAHRRSLILWGLGVTEQRDGSFAVMALSHLALLTGNIGKRGAGLIPLRGQNNVQGACDMGMLPYFLPDYREPEVEGLMTPDIIDGIGEGRIRALFNMGEDLAHVHPNQNKVRRFLKKLDLLVVQEVMFSEVTKYAHLLFGVKSGYEKEGVYINAERRLHLSQPLVPSDLPDDWEVIQGIGRHFDREFRYGSSQEIWDEVRRVAPSRFRGASYQLLAEKRLEGLQWPIGEKGDTPILHVGRFRTEDGFASFHYHPYQMRGMVKELLAHRDPHFYLVTGRAMAHYNNGAQTGASPQLAKRHREDILLVSERDREFFEGRDRVVLESRYGRSGPLPIRYTRTLKRGVLYTTFHHMRSHINSLFGDDHDLLVKTAAFKSIKVKIL